MESFAYPGANFYSREPVSGPLRPRERVEMAGLRDSLRNPILALNLQVFLNTHVCPRYVPGGERAGMEKHGKEFVTLVHMLFTAGLFARNEVGG